MAKSTRRCWRNRKDPREQMTARCCRARTDRTCRDARALRRRADRADELGGHDDRRRPDAVDCQSADRGRARPQRPRDCARHCMLLPVVMIENGNITIRLARTCPCFVGRVLEVIAARWSRGVIAALAWQIWLYAAKMAHARETTFVLQIPIAPFWFGVERDLWLRGLGTGDRVDRATCVKARSAMTPSGHWGVWVSVRCSRSSSRKCRSVLR